MLHNPLGTSTSFFYLNPPLLRLLEQPGPKGFLIDFVIHNYAHQFFDIKTSIKS